MPSQKLVWWWLPLAAFVVGESLLLGLGGDLWLADRIYALEGGRWLLQSHWLTESVLHTGARNAVALAWMGVVLAWLASLLRPQWQRWRKPLGYLALVTLVSTGTVSLLKSFSALDCPWDLARYGGSQAYTGLLQGYADSPGRCFPAGHASAGYSWLALYFFLLAVKPAWRRYGLVIGLGLGLLFGIDQQLRGAHFLSHDLFTAMICWACALGLYRVMLRPSQAGGAA